MVQRMADRMANSDATPASQFTTGESVRARKRVAIGLEPQRPTAKVAPLRPPVEAEGGGWRWWPVILLCAVILATLLLIMARALHSPTDWQPVRQNVLELFSRPWSGITIEELARRTRVNENFTDQTRLLALNEQADRWWMNVVPDEGVYRLNVWPGQVAWSTLGMHPPAVFRLETALSIAPETADGYGGLLARYQDPNNFYAFVIDGEGQFQAQVYQKGSIEILQPWIGLDFLHAAGQNNLMVLVDNGASMRLFLNNVLVFEVLEPRLPTGKVGVLGGASPTSIAEINVDWIKMDDVAE